jgi:hypothetical protein
MEIKTKYYLYLKESPKGVKYLGKTINDPYRYLGSCIIWRRHLKKHGFNSKDIKTIILFETTSKEELKEMGLFYSKEWDIVRSISFANLIEETGHGGNELHSEYWTIEKRKEQSDRMKINNPSKKEYVKEILKNIATGRKFSEEVNKKKGKTGDSNVSKRNDVKLKISESLNGHCVNIDTRKKISDSLKEWNKKNENPFKGMKHNS